ncbi:MAG: AAA family ATPase [Desulfuromonadales bacterium]
MSALFRQGLVVGKFSPLHRGHELLIRSALEQCEQVVIISYAKPEFDGCAADQREQWLTALFPSVRALVVTDERLLSWFPDRSVSVPDDDEPETVHRLFVGFLCRELLDSTVDAVFTSEEYGDGFAAELTGFFNRYSPGTAQVTHVLIDRERSRVPVSGTMVRADVHGCRELLSPQVYASFVKRICLLGGESTGKTTLAEALAEHFETVMVPEYGRELWITKNGLPGFEDMCAIAERQVEMEDVAIRNATRCLFCDTSPLTTLLYCRYLFNRNDEVLEQLAERPYDLYVLCCPDIAFMQDGTRQESGFREYQHAWYREQLAQRGIPWLEVSGSVAERVKLVATAIITLK